MYRWKTSCHYQVSNPHILKTKKLSVCKQTKSSFIVENCTSSAVILMQFLVHLRFLTFVHTVKTVTVEKSSIVVTSGRK